MKALLSYYEDNEDTYLGFDKDEFIIENVYNNDTEEDYLVITNE